MKRICAFSICLLLLISLLGCSRKDDTQETVNFYYPRIEYIYGCDGSVMGVEQREYPNSPQDLRFWLNLYLSGPSDETLHSPFPTGIVLEIVSLQEHRLIIGLNSKLSQLSGMDLTLACACLSRTCFELCDAEQIIIKSEGTADHPGISVTLNRDSILLTDSIINANADYSTTP